MNCVVCNQETPYAFCRACTPSYGTAVVLEDKKLVIYMGEIGLLHALKMRLRGYKVIRFWVGTDVLLLHKFPPGRGRLSIIFHRIKAFLLGYVVESNFMDGNGLLAEIGEVKWLRLKNLEVKIWCDSHEKYEKQITNEIIVAFYQPNNSVFSRWKYGIDFIENVQKDVNEKFPNKITWMKLDGSKNMRSVYPVLSAYLRPSRHDGTPRINLACELNDIPVIYDPAFSFTQQEFNKKVFALLDKIFEGV